MEPFIGQISVVAFNYAPKGWALCNGQLMSIPQNQALFAILGTQYGGDGISTFALPDLRGRAAMNMGSNAVGATGGVEAVQLSLAQIPAHTHNVMAISAAGTSAAPANGIWAASTGGDLQYAAAGTANAMMATTASGPGGADHLHDNMPPVTVLNFIVALQGIFPSKN